MLVISPAAADEAGRLGGQATAIVPCKPAPEVLEQVTTIDGALLVDPVGTCHAIGVILDGRATERGTRTGGSRFNSAVPYVEDRKEQFPTPVRHTSDTPKQSPRGRGPADLSVVPRCGTNGRNPSVTSTSSRPLPRQPKSIAM